MARRYAIAGLNAVTPPKTCVCVSGATTVRPSIYYIAFGGDTSAVADLKGELLVQRHTAAGTFSAVTPEPLEIGDVASLATANTGKTHSAEPINAGTPVIQMGVHYSSVFQWYAQEGGELICPATPANGYHATLNSLTSGTTALFAATMQWQE